MVLVPRGVRAYQHDVGPQTFQLAFDVVHAAERENFVSAYSDQVSESATFGVHLSQCQRCLHTGRCTLRAEVVLVVERAVQARNDAQRKAVELIVLTAAYSDELPLGDPYARCMFAVLSLPM